MSATLFPLVSADVALFSVANDTLEVLLVKRAQEPCAGLWALPGAVLKPDVDFDLEATARRALRDKVDVEIAHLEQVGAFSGADRDPRGWSIGVLFLALLARDRVSAVVRSKVEAIKWAGADHLHGALAFDHRAQLEAARQVLGHRVDRYALPLHLMPERFTLTELQRTCEAIMGRALDKSAFRRRLKSSHDIVEVPNEFIRGAQRPAQLYRAREGYRFESSAAQR
jgi:8-oxo-dGTP diphosphatase